MSAKTNASGRGVSLTRIVNAVYDATGVSWRFNRTRMLLLELPGVDVISTKTLHRRKWREAFQRRDQLNGDQKTIVIAHDGSADPEVYMTVDTLIFLMCEAVKGNEAHWARPRTATRDSDEGEL